MPAHPVCHRICTTLGVWVKRPAAMLLSGGCRGALDLGKTWARIGRLPVSGLQATTRLRAPVAWQSTVHVRLGAAGLSTSTGGNRSGTRPKQSEDEKKYRLKKTPLIWGSAKPRWTDYKQRDKRWPLRTKAVEQEFPMQVMPGNELPADMNNKLVYVDKPAHFTSFDLVAKTRSVMRLKVRDSFKVGHTGTLDPSATGLICLMLGSATKFQEGLTTHTKTYTMKVHLGESTPTLDKDTDVDNTMPWEHLTWRDVREAGKAWTGDIMQLPPMFSAVHHGGERLYAKARRGEVVEREKRNATVFQLDIECLDADGNPLGRTLGDDERIPSPLLRMTAHVSKGTFARMLAYDVAASAGTTGHISELRRIAIGDKTVDADAWKYDEFLDRLAELRQIREAQGLHWSNKHGADKVRSFSPPKRSRSHEQASPRASSQASASKLELPEKR